MALRLEPTFAPRVHYALQQNDVPVVARLRVENDGDGPVADLEVEAVIEPGVSEPWRARLQELGAGRAHVFETVDPVLRPEVLAALTERQRGTLRVEARCGEEVLARTVQPLELLAANEWPGTGTLPELLAAFVQPNHPVVARVLARAAALLQERTGDGALDGYQRRDPERVRAVVEALYDAVATVHVTYVTPPASFEREGQRVRTPDQVFDEHLGTCLDLAVLVAAAVEQAGLRPLVLLREGHAFAGAWLVDEGFAEAVVADPLPVRKRVELEEIAVFECTTLCEPAAPFARACGEGLRWLHDANAFHLAVDVRGARREGVRPLPLRAGYAPVSEPVAEVPPPAPGVPERPVPVPPPAGTGRAAAPETRFERWKRRLLDLSLRNRMLAFRPTRKSAPVQGDDVAALEDALSGGAWFALHPELRPDPDDPRQHEPGALAAAVERERAGRRLRLALTEGELDRRLIEIHRAARVAVEESGANTLHLALGFLRWFETPTSEQERRAPLLLLPVELDRPSAAEGFRLRLADEDARVNTTLLQKLETDHGLPAAGLDSLDEDDAGLDVHAILRRFRRLVRDVGRWEVVEEAWLGFFSFTKFVMWWDLHRRGEALFRNRFLRRLLAGDEEAAEPDGPFPDPGELDDSWDPAAMLCPVDADSSQLVAVRAAADGRSFVLEGPPGTGKSQTITNLIAQCLGEGRRVLFVAEKRAALEVVQRRLSAVGLGPFCLELHSNKGSKRAVVQQLARPLEWAGIRAPEEWEEVAERLRAERDELNATVQALHRVRLSGWSVFGAVARLVEHRGGPSVDRPVRWDEGQPEPDAARIAVWRECVDELAGLARAVGRPVHHPWRAARLTDWSPAGAERIAAALTDHGRALEAERAAARALAAVLGIAVPDTRAGVDGLAALAARLRELPAVPAALLAGAGFSGRRAVVERWIRTGRERNALGAGLAARWRPGLLTGAPLLDLHDGYRRWAHRPAWLRGLALWGARRRLRVWSRTAPGPAPGVLADLERALEVRRLDEALRVAGREGGEWLGALWQGTDTDWDRVAAVLDAVEKLRAEAFAVLRDRAPEEVEERLAAWGAFVAEPAARAPGTAVGDALGGFLDAHDASAAALEAVAEPLCLDLDEAFGAADAAGWFDRAAAQLDRWRDHLPALREWCAWRRGRDRAAAEGLGRVIAAGEDGAVPAAGLPAAFEHGLLGQLVAGWFEEEPRLRAFRGEDHERRIARFRRLDDRAIAGAGGVVAARLAARVPRAEGAVPSSELGLLLREQRKQRRHLAVRRLFQRIPNLLPRLAPCLLMSPLSVAQYLDPDDEPFDLVVFDEASQIPAWDAVGAIGRARALVVVGDSRQLPPTTFFQRLDDEDVPVDDDFEELESILDECGAGGLARLHLRWHYRSRHEALIAFSNHHYYDNRLLTFPSPAAEERGLGVRWCPVAEGVYDRGRSQTNEVEARALVEELVRRLGEPEGGRWSYGVVTFSVAQQALIEDLLDRARRERPELEPHFAADDGRGEPVFVKNLENVQGDERDVVLFSVCYGPDAAGRTWMHFGPLNREGGERRLNVAVTRARRELLVFSTLRAEDIDLTRTRARGARHLRAFLDYAERGAAALVDAVAVEPGAEWESPFERDVGRALEGRGYTVHRQVGCSGYRLDLAVVDPARPGRYLLGIECDGRSYHSAATARDRDRLRQAVLEGLGWRLHRVWSTDWWFDRERELERAEAAIGEARAAAAVEREADGEPAAYAGAAAPPAGDPTVTNPPVTNAPAGNPPAGDPPATVPSAANPPATAPPVTAPSSDEAVPPDGAAGAGSPPSGAGPPASPRAEPYPAVPDDVPGSPGTFHDTTTLDEQAAFLTAVVDREAPIVFDLAVRRLADAWGVGRRTARVRARTAEVVRRSGIPTTGAAGEDLRGAVLWRGDQDPEGWRGFRTPGPDSAPRRAEEIPVAEIANAAAHVLAANVALPAEDLARETARLFGITRLGRAVRERMEEGITLLLSRGQAARNGDTILAK